MKGIFNPSGYYFELLSHVADCMFLTMLWILFSLPLITLGAATTAVYYTVNKVICSEKGTLWKTYWTSFKENFAQSTLAGFFLLIICGILATDCYYLYERMLSGRETGKYFFIFLIMLMIAVMWMLYCFPYIAFFRDPLKKILTNSFLICLINLPWSVLLLGVCWVAVSIFTLNPVNLVSVLLVPTVYILISNSILKRIFRKYISLDFAETEKE